MRAVLHVLIALSAFASVASAAEVVPAPLEPWRAWARSPSQRSCLQQREGGSIGTPWPDCWP